MPRTDRIQQVHSELCCLSPSMCMCVCTLPPDPDNEDTLGIEFSQLTALCEILGMLSSFS